MIKFTELFRLGCRALAVLLASVALGVLALCFAFALPIDTIRQHVWQSLAVLQQETNSFSISMNVPGSALDNYTEALYLNQALVDGRENGLLRTVLSGYTYEGGSDAPIQNLTIALTSPDDAALEPTHVRFWNGYQVPVKFLLVFMRYSNIRQLNLFLLFWLCIFLCYLMARRKLQRYILPFLLALLFLRPITCALNMTFSGYLYCTLLPCLVMLLANGWLRVGYRYLYFFEIIGICVFYFNMNYFQLITFAVPMLFYFLINGFPEKLPDMLAPVGACFFMWFGGYAGMMVCKWALYAVVVDPGIFRDMITLTVYRTSAEHETGHITRLGAVYRNLQAGFGNIWWDLSEVGFLLGVLLPTRKSALRARLCRPSMAEAALLLVMIALPFARYMVFANHVFEHFWVTYRLLAITVFALNIFMVRVVANNGLE